MSSTKTVTDIDQVELVVDADAHIHEDYEAILSYLDDDKRLIKNMLTDAYKSGNMDDKIFSMVQPSPSGISSYGDGSTGKSQLELMDEFGIDYSVLGPSKLNGIPTINNPRFAVALANAYNSWVRDEFLEHDDRLKGNILAAPHRPDKAAQEINRRANEHENFVGVLIPPAGIYPPLGDRKYDPIYEAAEENGLTIVHHGTNKGCALDFPIQFRGSESKAESIIITHFWQQMWALTTTLFRGVPERYPDLNFVFQEAGAAWIPYAKWRLDDNYLEHPELVPELDRLPSTYFGDQLHFTTQPLGHVAKNPGQMADVLNAAGENTLMYSGDIPHPTFDPPEELFNPIKKGMTDNQLNNIMGKTAAEVYNL